MLMVPTVVDRVIEKANQALTMYHRLVLAVGSSGVGKTNVLSEVSLRVAAPLVNVNLELSRRMLDLTERQRLLELPRILSEIVDAVASDHDVVLLDNIEILFDVSLKRDPLGLLQQISRYKTVVASWNGRIDDGYLVYAVPGHSEFRRYPLKDFLFVDLNADM
jgi:hypothetical protein